MVVGALVGSMATGWTQAVTLGNRITRLETIVKVVAAKLEVEA